MSELNHPRIVKLKESWNNSNEVILVLELVSGGELFDYLAEREQLTENEAAGIIRQVLETIDYMHDLKIAHFDLKPENVMEWFLIYDFDPLIDFSLIIDPLINYRPTDFGPLIDIVA